jgi:exonuclease SbcD
MRFLHLADLHFGKSIHGVSMLENGDQSAWVERFLALAEELRPDAVLIAGDIYDRSAPSGDAVMLLDRMLTALAQRNIPVLMAAGNHDSGQRLSFAGSLLARQNLHIAGVLAKELTHVTLRDADGPVTFWLMPYVFPALVAQVLEDDSIRDYDTAVRALLARQNVDFSQRNVLVAHQNVIANGKEAVRGGSESMVGGVGGIDYTAFDGFDYVALGHIHSAYAVGRETVRYAGSPLCYHFEETRQQKKGPVLVELGPKGTAPVLQTQSIRPLHPMREVRGSYPEIEAAERTGTAEGEYVRVVLTDRRVTPEISDHLHSLFENRGSILMELVSEYDPFAAVAAAATPAARAAGEKAVEELFADFYTQRKEDAEPDEAELAILRFAGEQVRHGNWEDRNTPDPKTVDALLKFVLEQEAEQ